MKPALNPLRPHQQLALDGIRNSLMDGHRKPMLQAPCGFGKTVVGAHIVARARERGKRVAFVAPALSLIDQTFQRFVENGIEPSDMGVLQGDHPWHRPHAPIQICSAQTLARRGCPEVDVAVIDEAHIRQTVIDQWMASANAPVFVGLSATPWAAGLGQRYDDLIKPTSLAELIELGYLSKFRVYAPSHPDLTGVATVKGDYHEGQLCERMSKAEIVADVVSTWLLRAAGLPTLCFAVNRAHAQVLAQRFHEAGVPTAYIDAKTPREEREEIGRDLHTGKVHVVVNVGCLTTGVDWDVRALILARPTKSEMLFVQIIGRALRTAPGKTEALILDHSDTHLRLGMVTDIDFDELDDGSPRAKAKAKERKERIPEPRECMNCAVVVPAAMKECPSCGAVAQRPTGVNQLDGDLSELGRDGRPKGKPESARSVLQSQGKRAVYMQLLWVAEDKGRAIGWAGHAYKEIFGDWPRGLSKMLVAEPTPQMRSWLRSRDIDYAKARAARTEVAYGA